jgi:hypothetical protein
MPHLLRHSRVHAIALVWGIGRIVTYDEHALPSVTTTLAALRKKYGEETSRNEGSPGSSQTLIWIYDGDGNRLVGNRVGIVADGCTRLGVSSGNSRADVQYGYEKNVLTSIDCSTYSFLTAKLEEYSPTQKDLSGGYKPPGLLRALMLQAICYPLRRANYEATSIFLDQVRQQRDHKEQGDAAKRVPVL